MWASRVERRFEGSEGMRKSRGGRFGTSCSSLSTKNFFPVNATRASGEGKGLSGSHFVPWGALERPVVWRSCMWNGELGREKWRVINLGAST
jgi:hypothetical protein